MTTQPDAPDAADATTLLRYVKAVAADQDYVTACEARAEQLVSDLIGLDTVPAVVRRAAVLEVGSDLFHRRNTRQGISYVGDEGMTTAVRVSRDPLAAARPILRPYLTPGIA